MSYISVISHELNKIKVWSKKIVVFGENIDTGSKLSGLAKSLTTDSNKIIINVGNCELTHCAVGMGMMLDGGHGILLVKQLDFLLLGLDQIVNTNNFLRAAARNFELGSFTIVTIVCDQGFQGPQSSLNDAGGFSSIANIPVYCLNSKADITKVLRERVTVPGLKMVCISQSLFNETLNADIPVWTSKTADIFQYFQGDDCTIVSFNFCLEKSMQIHNRLANQSLFSDLFHCNYVPELDFSRIATSCAASKSLLVLDDSKGVNKASSTLVKSLLQRVDGLKVKELVRPNLKDNDYSVCSDSFNINMPEILDWVSNPNERCVHE